MKEKMDVDEVRDIQISILDYFHEYCEKNQLRYSLCGGTLLGAVRHSGYIPWDDDIDVMMPRPDYERLLSEQKSFSNGRFIIKSPTDKNTYYPYPYVKICDSTTILIENLQKDKIKYHIYIDVFPIDGLPQKNVEKYYKKITRYCLSYFFLSCSYYKINQPVYKKIMWKIIYLLSKIIRPSTVAKIIEKKVLKYNFDKSEYVGNVISGYGLREINKRQSYSDFILFEGKKYHMIREYDSYLKNLYGNYMELPPKEQQVRRHDFVAYRLNKKK